MLRMSSFASSVVSRRNAPTCRDQGVSESEHVTVETELATTRVSRTSMESQRTRKSAGSNARIENEYGDRLSWE
jgi:hypothetical protein